MLCAHSHKNLLFCLQEMNRSHTAAFSQEEQVFMKNIKNVSYSMAKSNTAAATNARERSKLKLLIE